MAVPSHWSAHRFDVWDLHPHLLQGGPESVRVVKKSNQNKTKRIPRNKLGQGSCQLEEEGLNVTHLEPQDKSEAREAPSAQNLRRHPFLRPTLPLPCPESPSLNLYPTPLSCLTLVPSLATAMSLLPSSPLNMALHFLSRVARKKHMGLWWLWTRQTYKVNAEISVILKLISSRIFAPALWIKTEEHSELCLQLQFTKNRGIPSKWVLLI